MATKQQSKSHLTNDVNNYDQANNTELHLQTQTNHQTQSIGFNAGGLASPGGESPGSQSLQAQMHLTNKNNTMVVGDPTVDSFTLNHHNGSNKLMADSTGKLMDSLLPEDNDQGQDESRANYDSKLNCLDRVGSH